MTNCLNIVRGGNVLASGGYGCVFSPALKCKGKTHRVSGKISKLMTAKHAEQEFEEIELIKTKLDVIPHYRDYFILEDITICQPDKLSDSDLSNYTKTCTSLPKNDITKKNINNKLDELLLLNIPDGGLAVDDYIYKDGSYIKLKIASECLLNLFKNGITKMNEKHIYHCDIKDSNILIKSEEEHKARLIDWGLATHYIPFKDNKFPKSWRNRPLQFNVPFSVLLFTDTFVKEYTKFIKSGKNAVKEDLRPFIISYLHLWTKERGAGHYKFINEIMYTLFSKDFNNLNENDLKIVIENEFTLVYITNYMIDVLENYTVFRKDGTLNLREYLDNVFIKNADVWGFCTAFYPLLELYFNNYDNFNSNEAKIFKLLKELFMYIYTTASTKLSHDKIETIITEIISLLDNQIVSDRGTLTKSKSNKKNTTKENIENVENKKIKKMKQKEFILIKIKI